MGMVILRQLEGENPRTVELAGHAAPHGRPRKDPVTEEESRVAFARTHYPGGSEVPTTHIFGLRNQPLELKGRFRDSLGGKGFAKAKFKELKDLHRDMRLIQVTWDDVLDVTGLMVRFKGGWESPGELVWEAEIEVDRDLLVDAPFKIPEVKGPQDITNQILAALKLKDDIPKQPPTLKGSVVDVLNGLVGSVNGATAVLLEASNQIDSFATGTFTALRRLRAGLGQAKVAVQNLRNTYDSLVVTAAIESELATNESQQFWDLQSAWAASSLEALRLMALAEREAAKAEQGRILALHEAAIGETWESIASRWYGSEERAGDIRTANGVDVGLEPVPGVVYFVPR